MSGKNPLGNSKEPQAYEGINVIVPVGGWRVVRSTRNPTTSDIKYPIASLWVNTTNNTTWILTSNPGMWTLVASPAGGALTVINQTGTAVNLTAQSLNITNAGSSLVTYTLPTKVPAGTTIEIVGSSAGGWTIAQNSGQTIVQNALTTTAGTGGSVSSVNKNTSVELVAVDSTTNVWNIFSTSGGSLTFV